MDFVIFRKGNAKPVCKKNKFFKDLRVKKKSRRKKKNSFARIFFSLVQKEKDLYNKAIKPIKERHSQERYEVSHQRLRLADPNLSAEPEMGKVLEQNNTDLFHNN